MPMNPNQKMWPMKMPKGEMLAVDTPDGVHMNYDYGSGEGTLDWGPYRPAPMMPQQREGAMNGQIQTGSRSGRGKTVSVK